MAVGDIFKLVVHWVAADPGNVMINTFHYRQDLALIFDTPEEDLVQAWIADAETSYSTAVTNTMSIVKYQVIPRPAGAVSYEVSATTVGGATGDALPYQTSPLITWRTGIPGRRFRGRSYFPPTVEANQVGGVLTLSFRNGLQAIADGLMEIGDGVNEAIWTLGVYSEIGPTFTPITAAVVNPLLATQRRRRT